MAYFTGVPNTMSAFAQAIVAAAASVGWTIDANSPSTGDYAFHSPAGDYWSIKEPLGNSTDNGGNSSYPYLAAGAGLYIYTNSGYNSARNMFSQPPRANTGRVPARAEWFGCAGQSGPFIRYHIFASSTYLHCVLEIRAKVFCHLQFGRLDKKGGSYVGGQYTQKTLCNLSSVDNPATSGSLFNTSSLYLPWNMSTYDGSSQADEPSAASVYGQKYSMNLITATDVEKSGRWCYTPAYKVPALTSKDPELWGWVGPGGGKDTPHPDAMLLYGSANELTGATVVIPIRIYLQGAQNRTYFMGEVADMGVVDMSFLSPGQSLYYGADEWMVFPAWRFNLDDLTNLRNSSGYMGYAFRVNR